jgi:hypothetical protein
MSDMPTTSHQVLVRAAGPERLGAPTCRVKQQPYSPVDVRLAAAFPTAVAMPACPA